MQPFYTTLGPKGRQPSPLNLLNLLNLLNPLNPLNPLKIASSNSIEGISNKNDL